MTLRQDWMDARTTRAFDEVERLGHAILRAAPGDEPVSRALGRLLAEQGRHGEALAHWRALLDADARDLEAAFHVAARAPDGAPDGAPPPAPGLRAALDEALRQWTATPPPPIHHVAICGVSFCGSTLLDRVLGGLPGVASIGESHWLASERGPDGLRAGPFRADSDDARLVHCSACGPGCAVLTRPFRLGLAADRTGWYGRIAQALGVRVLVSSDKNAPKLVDNDPLLRMAGLVLFKSPAQAWRSKLDKLPPGLDDEARMAECRTYIRVWTRSYRGFLDRFAPEGPVAFLSFDAFAAEPERHLRAACAALGLPFDARVLSATRPGHGIGGNAGSMRRLRERGFAVAVEPLGDPALAPAQARALEADAAMQATHRDLLARHRALLAAAPRPTPVP